MSILTIRWKTNSIDSKFIASENFQTTMTPSFNPKIKIRDKVLRTFKSTIFPNATVKSRNILPKAKPKPSFVIVNVHHSIHENEVKEALLNNNAKDVIKVHRVSSRARGKPTKLICVITDCSKHVTAAANYCI